MTTFSPRVNNTDTIGSWQARMPHPLRSKVWSLLFDIQDHVVSIHDDNPTEITVAVNKGYEALDGLAILVTAIYGSLNTDIELLTIITTYKEHLLRMHEQINFGNELPVENLLPYLSKLISMRANSAVKNAVAISPINTNYVTTYRGFVIEAKKRLEFVPLTDLTIMPWEKSKRLKRCTEVIDYMDSALTEAERLNVEIEKCREITRDAIASFQHRSETSPVTCGDELRKTLGEIDTQNKVAKLIFDGFDFDTIKAQWEEISRVTPPAPVPASK